MVRIAFVHPDGTRQDVLAEVGISLMQVAVNNDVPGIGGDCGGACACATCHCLLDGSWSDHIEAACPAESEMLEYVSDASPNSRLACQVEVTPLLDGIVINIPAT